MAPRIQPDLTDLTYLTDNRYQITDNRSNISHRTVLSGTEQQPRQNNIQDRTGQVRT